jgi:hypothetical protein
MGTYMTTSKYSNSGFTKTGGTIYGDTDSIVGNGNATDNTATDAANPGQNGHAVLYAANTYWVSSTGRDVYYYFYRNETLGNDASGNISPTEDPMSTMSNWNFGGDSR